MYDIEINELSVYYGSVCALNNINLKVKSKEFIGITGPNGGGKTTLLRVIINLLSPTTGSILIKGKKSIGYVPQFPYFDSSFPISVIEVVLTGNLSRNIAIFKPFSKEDKQYAKDIMYKLDILKLKDRQIGQLSGGELKKVLIARALINNPKILILDEPTVNIDSKTKKDIFSFLKILKKSITIIIVSHDLDKVFELLDSIVYIDENLYFHKECSNINYKMLQKINDYHINKNHRKYKDDKIII